MAACRGDRTAYAPLVRRYYKQVLLVCIGILGNLHDAEDVAQDAMIKGLEKIKQLKEPDQFSHWIVKIARNLSINFLRRKAAMDRVVEQATLWREHPALAPSSHGQDGRATQGRDALATTDLQRAVARLPWDLRLPLVMYYFDGRSVKAVAEKLNVSTSGVYSKLRTAIRELHEILTEPGEMP